MQESIKRRRLTGRNWYKQRDLESRREYKEARQVAKREVAKAKGEAYDELYERLDTKEGEKVVCRLARQRDKYGKDVQKVRTIKDADGNTSEPG